MALILQDLLEPQAGLRALASIPLYAFLFFSIFACGEILQALGLPRAGFFVFHGAFVLHFSACFLFDAFYEDAVHRRYSILDADSGNVFYLLRDVIPVTVVLSIGCVLFLVYALAPFVGQRIVRAVPVAALGMLLSGAGAVQADTPTLHAYFIRDVRSYSEDAPVTDAIRPTVSHERDFADRDILSRTWTGRTKRIVLFVMESVTAEELEESCTGPDCVFRSHAGEAHRYENYFSANQDSRTGILSLLFSRFIPYPAYPERDVRQYEHLKGRPSLLDLLHKAGYTTTFAAAVLEKERILTDLPWKKRILLTTDQAKTNVRTENGAFVCLNPYEFEHSCEDRILLDQLVDHVARNDRIFLLQEFLYGHTGEYVRIRGQRSASYYGAYVAEFMRRLAARGVLDDTLIVVTSDHGQRNPSGLRNVENYRLPLYFFRKGQTPAVHREFLAPMDFTRILAAEEAGVRPATAPRSLVPIMGSTGSGIVGLVSADKRLVLVKNRRWGARVMLNEAGRGGMTPASLLGILEGYRSIFPSL